MQRSLEYENPRIRGDDIGKEASKGQDTHALTCDFESGGAEATNRYETNADGIQPGTCSLATLGRYTES